jgi:hypothetical protein
VLWNYFLVMAKRQLISSLAMPLALFLSILLLCAPLSQAISFLPNKNYLPPFRNSRQTLDNSTASDDVVATSSPNIESSPCYSHSLNIFFLLQFPSSSFPPPPLTILVNGQPRLLIPSAAEALGQGRGQKEKSTLCIEDNFVELKFLDLIPSQVLPFC